MDILYNPENDSYGFRIVVPPNEWNSTTLRWEMPSAHEAHRIYRAREEIAKANISNDDYYEYVHYDIGMTEATHDFWFANREMALLIKLAI